VEDCYACGGSGDPGNVFAKTGSGPFGIGDLARHIPPQAKQKGPDQGHRRAPPHPAFEPEPESLSGNHSHAAVLSEQLPLGKPRPQRSVAVNDVRALVSQIRPAGCAPASAQRAVSFMKSDLCTGLGRSNRRHQAAKSPADDRHSAHFHTIPYGTVPTVPARSDWLSAGLEVLASEGADSLRIDRLCTRLGVSKGSFHHHFAGSASYRQALLAEYEQRATESLKLAIAAPTGTSPRTILARLTDRVESDQLYRPELEVAVRAWAFSDIGARQVQERIDQARIDALEQVWKQLVEDPAEARTAALLPYLVAIGASLVRPPVEAGQLRRVYELLLRLVPDDPTD
jgi:AcrR family transcriptional regulator